MNYENSANGLEIAIIGMAARFPGAKNIDEFWENLKNGVESIPFFSDEELKEVSIDAELKNNSGYVRTRGGIIEESVYFDAHFFGYNPNEAEVMTPQTRVFHECCWEALEDAGYDPWSGNGTIGLYAGGRNSSDWQLLTILSGKNSQLGEPLSSTLYDKDNMTFRVSYNFNLKGPSFSLNTACSTALVAIHLACQGLLSGECDMALAGAAAITAYKSKCYRYQEGDIISPDGHLRAFDARAKGLVYSDGVGVVLLKALEEAVTDRDHIYAIIKGSAINNDGHNKVSYTAPAVKGQETVIRAALHMAEVEPESVGYVETHGTGTTVGDPIEIQALKQAFNSDKKHFCAIGSIKTNVGHMTEAAGIGGFIKTVLALKHRLVPPTLHFETPNPVIHFENTPFYVNTKLKEWKSDQYPLRAGVSSFARGGTNAHVVLEEAPDPYRGEVFPSSRDYFLILLSAKTQLALDKMTENLVEYLKKNPRVHLADAAYTWQVGRKIFEYRRKLVCTDGAEAARELSSPDSRKMRTFSSKEEDRPVVFMFPGLDSQYVNMGLELYQRELQFREEMDRCFEILRTLGCDDLKEILYPDEGAMKTQRQEKITKEKGQDNANSRWMSLEQIEIAQTVIFIFEYSLAKLLMKWGITPYAMIGYSFGELVAAAVSGVFSLEDVLKLILARGQLIRQIPGGIMLSVPLSREKLKPLLSGPLSIAIDNGPSCIAAGPEEAMNTLEHQLKKKKYLCMPLSSSHALHSQMMAPILTAFEERVRQVTLNEPQIPYISNVTGKWITLDDAADPGYWVRHLRETVRFADGIKELVKEENAVFVEVGPGRDLSALVVRYLDKHLDQQVINLVRPPGKEVSDINYLLNRIGDLWLYGKKIGWSGFYSHEKRNRIPLPTYPFQRQPYTIAVSSLDLPDKFRLVQGIQYESSAGDQPTDGDRKDSSPFHTRPNLTNPYVAPRDTVECAVTSIWKELLGFKEIGIEDDFLEMGGDSLKAVTLVSRIHKKYNIVVPLEEFFKTPTIQALSQYINHAEKSPYSSLKTPEKKEYYVLSSAQKRLYILQQMELENVGYNLPQAYIMERKPDRKKLESGFRTLLERHESLKTSFEVIDGEPVQKVHKDVEFEIDYHEITHNQDEAGSKEKAVNRDFVKPFDLSRAPLVRVGLININQSKYILIADMHHIVADGVSNAVLIQEFIWLYAGEELPPLRFQYKDYAEWQNSQEGCVLIKQQETYWLKELEGELPRVNLPTDFPRFAVRSFEGSRVNFEIGLDETERLKELARQENVTLYMALLAIFNVVLSKLSGMDEIIIGADIAGRNHADLEQIIGVFINTLVLRTYLAKKKSFKNFLAEVKVKTLEAFENQDYQFENLVEKLLKKRDSSRNPIFDIMFSYESYLVKPLEVPQAITQLKMKSYGDESRMSKLDLMLKVRIGLTIDIAVEYSTQLFKESTIERFIKYFKEITSTVIEKRNIKLEDIRLSHDLLAVKADISAKDLEF